MGMLINGRLGRKWFQEAFDRNDLKPRKYRIKMASFSFAISGEVGRAQLLFSAEIYFLCADLFVWKIFFFLQNPEFRTAL